MSAVLVPLLLLAVARPGTAVTPSGEIVYSGGTVYAAPAAFGKALPSDSGDPLSLTLVRPLDLQDGCDPTVKLPSSVSSDGFALLVQRSPNCTFEDRLRAAQTVNASSVVVQNTIEGILQNRSHGEAQTDYECDNGKSWVSSKKDEMDGFPLSSCAKSSACDSGRCLWTGATRSSDGAFKVCCAWDLYMTMATSGSASDIKIPGVFVTMRDGDDLVESFTKAKTRRQLKSSTTSVLSIDLGVRWRPWMNLSSLLIWAMGVATVAYAAWRSVDDLRRKIARSDALTMKSEVDVVAVPVLLADADDEEEPPALELTFHHAIGFIAIASSVLLVLFYIDLYLLVTIMFCISSASSVGQVLLRPLFSRLLGPQSKREVGTIPYLGGVSMLDAACSGVGMFLAALWFATRNTSDWAFVLQDTFGMCLCVLFLGVIRFSNMKVAALLLTMAFFYDIFFVFISPYFFTESVMVRVATGSGPTADPDYCEKYPSDSDCQSTELPMLLLLPRINDYEGGDTMLGLGDIVLPGLLVAFAARYDVSIRANVPGHYILMVCGYAVGLLLANFAVYAMNTGQPALLYLVPCTLGVLSFKAWREGTLHDLWHGPPSLREDGGQPMVRKDHDFGNGTRLHSAAPTKDKDTEGEPLLTHTV